MKIRIPRKYYEHTSAIINKRALLVIAILLTAFSIYNFFYYYENGLGLSYNDARSHLDIGRRVVEGLNPGLAQIGSVWLPLPHLLMVPTIWNDFMWHSGLSGALQSMVSFVLTGILVYKFLGELKVNMFGRLTGVALFAINLNILYLQSTAMTELLLLVTMTGGSYYLLLWAKKDQLLDLLKASALIMLSTLIRYDGWFLILFATLVIAFTTLRKKGYKTMEGTLILFLTLGGVGIALWVLWNLLIFGDPLYFAFGPFSAHAQQEQLLAAGNLPTKGNLILSTKIYIYALLYNSYTLPLIISFFGFLAFLSDKSKNLALKLSSLTLLAPLGFNIIALYLGHSVLFIQGLSGTSWFNVRYGIMLAPTIAIFTGFLVERLKDLRWVVVGLLSFVLFFAFANADAVTIDDATVGSSQKNVSEVSGWLSEHAKNKEGFILISAASHDAIIFSSGLPMKRFIHEGTGAYWESAIVAPDRWARFIIMRTHDENDLTYRNVSKTDALEKYNLVNTYPFADIYEIKEEYLNTLNTKPVFQNK